VFAFAFVAPAADGQQNAASVMADMRSGLVVTYQVSGNDGPEVAARLRAPLGAYSVWM
jgi:hypothetical protein